MKKRLLTIAFLCLFSAAFAKEPTLDESIEKAAQQLSASIDGNVKALAVLDVRCSSPALSDYIVTTLNYYLSTDLQRTAIVVRDEYSRSLVQKEFDYQLSGFVSDETAQSICNALGADSIVLGSMEQVSDGWLLSLRAMTLETQKVLVAWRGKISEKDKELRFQLSKPQTQAAQTAVQSAQAAQPEAAPAPTPAAVSTSQEAISASVQAPSPAAQSTAEAPAQKSAGSSHFEIDCTTIPGNFKDHIVLLNKTQSGACTVTVSASSGSSFMQVGSATLSGFDSEGKIKSTKTLKLSTFRYFAFDSREAYAYKVTKLHNDLVVEVRDSGSDLSKPEFPRWTGDSKPYMFDTQSFSDIPDEEMKIVSSSAGVIGFYTVYVYDKKTAQWIIFGSTQTKKPNSAAKVKRAGDVEDIDNYRYYAVVAQDGRSHNYSALPNGDDLFVYVSE